MIVRPTGRNTSKAGRGWPFSAVLIALLVSAPLVVVISAMFLPGSEHWQHLRATVLPGYISNTLWLLLGVSAVAAGLGIPTAWLCSTTEFSGRRSLSWLLVLPLAAPAYVIAYVYTDLLEYAGPLQSSLRTSFGWQAGDYWFPSVRSLGGAILVLGFALYPYVYLLCRTVFERQSAALYESARLLGATPTSAFWRIALPSARPAIAGGLALVMMETAADFGVVEYFGVATFSTGIFRAWFGMGDTAAALQLAAGLFIVAGLLVLFERLGRRGQVANPVARSQPPRRVALRGAARWWATGFCTLPVLLGFALPMVILLRYAITVGDPMFGTRFSQMILNSFGVASVSALIATGFALVLCYAERLNGSRTVMIGTRVATLGYALPGAMLGLGVMVALIDLDHAFATWRKSQFGGAPQLLLTGTVVALVFAYVVRFLTVAYNTCHAGLSKIHPRLDDVGRTLGATPTALLQRVHLPLMGSAMVTALLLVFIDVIKELPATLILRPFNFDTLATRVYQLAADERLPEASTAALCIVLLGLLPALLLNRASRTQTSAVATTAAPTHSPG